MKLATVVIGFAVYVAGYFFGARDERKRWMK